MSDYVVQATVSTDHQGWWASRVLPTFLLDPVVQGITGPEHATRIAREIIDPWHEYDCTITATAVADGAEWSQRFIL